MGYRGYKGLQGVSKGYKGLLRVTRGYRELQGFTGDSKRKNGVLEVTGVTGVYRTLTRG